MNIREISKPVTADALNESLAKRFGQKLNLEKFTMEQLQDTRNKIRTKLSQIETNESFDSVHTDEGYQKSKLFLDILNAELSERTDVLEKGAKPDYLDFDKDGDKKEPMKKALKDKKKKPVGEDQVDEFYGVDSDDPADKNLMKAVQKKFGTNKKGRNLGRFTGNRYWKYDGAGGTVPADMDVTLDDPAVKMMLDAGILTLNPSALKKYKAMKGESIVREGEEDKAELVMAAKDMVDRLTGWMEDTAEMQSESMLELADAIRDEMGQAASETFTSTVKPGLDSLYTAMEATRVALTNGVAQLTGEGEPADAMGAEAPIEEPAVDAEMEPTVDAEAADEFAAAEPAAGGEEEAGRAKRESVELSRRLGTILSSKK